MMSVVKIYSDLACPWALVAVHRLRRARDDHKLEVVFDPRPWPLEWVNQSGTPRTVVDAEAAVLAGHEPDLFGRYAGESWPSTLLAAFEAVAAARRVAGIRGAEEVDYRLRLAFLRDSADISLRHVLADTVASAGLDADQVMATWSHEPVRGDVLADYARSHDLAIQGSPQIFWPDGTTSHNPGMSEHDWVRGIPRLRQADADEPARQLLTHTPSHDPARARGPRSRSPRQDAAAGTAGNSRTR